MKKISLEEGFLLSSFFENFNFWTTLFSKMVPDFWLSVWTSVKVKPKNYFYFTDLFAKIYCLLTHVHKTPPLRSHYCRYRLLFYEIAMGYCKKIARRAHRFISFSKLLCENVSLLFFSSFWRKWLNILEELKLLLMYHLQNHPLYRLMIMRSS